MSTIAVEQPRQPLMASLTGPSAATKPTASTPSETKRDTNTAASTTPEPMDVDMDKTEDAPSVELVATETLKEGEAFKATVQAIVAKRGESLEETSRKMAERAKRRLEIQMQFVENARRKILDETHPDMAERLQVLLEERDRRLRVAEQRSEYFQHGTAVIFDYECDEANSEYEVHCEKLRQDMLDEIQHEMEILHDQRKGGHTYVRATTRKTRSTRNKDNGSGPLDIAQKMKKRAGYVFQPLENKLAQSEIDHDVRELTDVYESSKKRRMDFDTDGEPPLVAKYHRNKLLYREWVFQEGDEVYVLNYSASSEYVAVVCAVSSTEVLVLSEKGKYYRLLMNDLRLGRVVLTTLAGDVSASRDDEGDASP